jgi:hypothetical protein
MLKLNLSKLSTYSCYENYTVSCHSYERDQNQCDIPSDISDKLIRIAAKVTERYASDLLIEIRIIERDLVKKLHNSEQINETFWFGFRDSGVDHTAWIENTSVNEFQTRYIQVWKLEVNEIPTDCSLAELNWKLTRMSNYVSKEDYEEVEETE